MQFVRPVVRSALNKAPRRSYTYGSAPADHKVPSFNDLPIPQGNWQEEFNKRTAKYNRMLILGTVVFAAGVGSICMSPCICWNWTHPANPAPRG